MREEPVVGDERGELAAAVVAVLLHHADDERRRTVSLLPSVERGRRPACCSVPDGGRREPTAPVLFVVQQRAHPLGE